MPLGTTSREIGGFLEEQGQPRAASLLKNLLP